MQSTKHLMDDVALIRSILITKFQFFGYIALSTNINITDNIPKAAVDGIELFINPNFWESLSQVDRLYIISHEIMHLALRHVTRRQWRQPHRWNIAADIIVNEILRTQGLRYENFSPITYQDVKNLIEITASSINNMSAEMIYDMLPEDVSSILNSEECLELNPGDRTKQQIDVIEDKWKQILRGAIANSEKEIGNLPNWLKREIDLVPSVMNWRTLLTNFVASSRCEHRSFRRPSRRHLWRNIIMANNVYGKLTLLIAIDVSSSITQDEYSTFISEISQISRMDNVAIMLIACDTRITHEELLYYGETPSMEIYGGGGTSFIPIFDYPMEKKFFPDGIIVLTDGYGSYPQKQVFPTLWVLTQNHQNPPWGLKTYIEAKNEICKIY